MTELLKIFTLGALTIQRGSTPVTGFVSRKVDALLVYLACEPREHPRELLAELFWDDLAANRALGNLRTALSSLQAQLADCLIVTRQTVAFNPDIPCGLDVKALESGLNLAESQWARQGRLLRSNAMKLDESLALYKGDFLAGFHLRDSRGFEGWQLLEQERLRGRVIEAYMRLVDYSLDRGEYTAGIAQAQRLLQIDPLWEDSHRRLMRLLALDGQRNAALGQYETCRRLLKDDLEVEPEPETEALYQQIQRGELSPTEKRSIHAVIPIPPTQFVGRSVELAQIAERLDSPDCRLLTLVGLGGIGKTRLALQAGADRVGDFRDGVYFVPLVALTSPDYLAQTIGSTVNVTFHGNSDTAVQVVEFLRDKEILLVLDSFEELLAHSKLLTDILANAAAVKILVTSRERLNLHEEWVLQIEGMDYPETPDLADQPGSDGALQLFDQCARRVQPAFSRSVNQTDMIRICKLTEGMPLGLELAATWTRLMTCGQIADQIERDLDLLSTSLRNIPERHRSIRVLFEQSWRSLTESEQLTLMKLSVCRGGFTQEAALEIAGGTPSILLSLIEKSLVRSDPSGRCDMHELLRRYAQEKLEETGEVLAARRAHLVYFNEWGTKLYKTIGVDPDVFKRIDPDYDNFRNALAFGTETNEAKRLLNLSTALTYYWRTRGFYAEGRRWIERALDTTKDESDLELTPLKARACNSGGILAWGQGDLDEAHRLLETSLSLFREVNNEEGARSTLSYLSQLALGVGDYMTARTFQQEALILGRKQGNKLATSSSLSNLGLIALELGESRAAKSYFEESLAIDREIGSQFNTCYTLINLGVLAVTENDFKGAQTYFEESLAMARDQKQKPEIALNLVNLAEVSHKTGKRPRAFDQYKEGLALFHEMGDKVNIAGVIETFSFLVMDEEELEQATLLLGAAQAIRDAVGAFRTPRESQDYDQRVTTIKGFIGEAEFAAAWGEGQCMNIEQVVNYALGLKAQS